MLTSTHYIFLYIWRIGQFTFALNFVGQDTLNKSILLDKCSNYSPKIKKKDLNFFIGSIYK